MSVAAFPDRPSLSELRRRRATKPILAAALLVGIVAWAGSDRKPIDPTEPVVIRGRASSQPDGRLRLGTFNIHGGRGPSGVVDLDATARLLRHPSLDLVGLYEVHGGFTTDQAEQLGEKLGMASVFAATERRYWHDHFGNGLLAGRPVRSVIRLTLPGTQGKSFRNALLTTVDFEGTPVRVISVHIDTDVDRERQLAVVFELFRSLQAPAVLMGDLNCTSDHPALAGVLADPGVVDALAGLTLPEPPESEEDGGRIDHLLVRGLTVVDAGLVETPASDHPYAWAELAIPEP